MIDRNDRSKKLPPRPGTQRGAMKEADDKIIVEVQGQQFLLDPVAALAMAGTIVATVEVYMRARQP